MVKVAAGAVAPLEREKEIKGYSVQVNMAAQVNQP